MNEFKYRHKYRSSCYWMQQGSRFHSFRAKYSILLVSFIIVDQCSVSHSYFSKVKKSFFRSKVIPLSKERNIHLSNSWINS